MGLRLRGHFQMFCVIYMLCLQVVLVCCKGKITGRATCESTGLGKPARVTCHYGVNVEKERDVIAVFLLHEKDGKQEKVVECHRFLNNGFDCLSNVGYKRNGTLSDRTIINIPRALPEHEGTYYCEIGIQQAEIQLDSCYLEYQVPNDSTTPVPPSEQRCDDYLEGVSDAGTSATVITLSVLLSVVLTVISLTGFFVFVRRRRRFRRILWLQDELKHITYLSPLLRVTGGGDGPDKKDTHQPSYKLTEVEDSSGGVSDNTTRDAHDRSPKEFPISAWSHIGDNRDVHVTAKSPSTSEVHSDADKKRRTEDNSHCGDHFMRDVTDPQ